MLLSAVNSDFGQQTLSYPWFGEENSSSPMQRYPYNYSGELVEQKMVHPSTAVSSSFFQMRPDISFAQVEPLVSPSHGLSPVGRDPSRMAMHIQQLMCKVCGDTASGNHFGVLSCEACKSFFRRSVRSGTQYACRGSRDCNIQKTTRNRCQYCRLQKCMAVGMRKEAVQEERKPVTGRDEPLTPTKANASSTTLHSPPASSQHSPTLATRQRYHSSLPNIPYNAGQLGHTEESSDQCSRGNLAYDSSLTLESLLLAEKDIIEPTPGEQTAGGTVSTNEVFHAAKESLIRIIEWSKRVPVFASLPIADQVKLLKATWAEVMMLRLSIRTSQALQEGTSSIVLATGRTITPDDTDDPQLSYVFTRVREELARWFVTQSIDTTEIVFLQAVILFNPDSRGISPAGKEKVSQLQKQVLHMMEEYIRNKFPSDKLRFPLLLLRLTTIKAISIDVVQHMEMHRTLGDTHLDRILIELLDTDS